MSIGASFIYQVFWAPTLAHAVFDWMTDGPEQIGRSPLVTGSLCLGLLLTCAAPTGHCCYTWVLRAVWCGWAGQRLGLGGSGPQAQLQLGLVRHKQDGLALHRAPLSASMGSLSSAGNFHPPSPPG